MATGTLYIYIICHWAEKWLPINDSVYPRRFIAFLVLQNGQHLAGPCPHLSVATSVAMSVCLRSFLSLSLSLSLQIYTLSPDIYSPPFSLSLLSLSLSNILSVSTPCRFLEPAQDFLLPHHNGGYN